MNAAGRHYRDQGDTTNPVCDYDACVFFETDEHRNVPYPAEISLGAESVPQDQVSSSDMSEIMSLLLSQKADNDQRHQTVLDLQKQVTGLLESGLAGLTSSFVTTAATTAPTVTTQVSPTYSSTVTTAAPVYSLPSAVPHHIASAAGMFGANLASTMYGHQAAYSSYPGLSQASAVPQQHSMFSANPLEGMGAAMGFRKDSQVSSVDQLYAATIKSKKLRAFEFAQNSQFPYKSQVKISTSV